MTVQLDNRDLSQLTTLLAAASARPTAKPAKLKKVPPIAANDNRAPDVLAWPALERLAHRGDAERAFALRHWKNLCHPGSGYEPEVDTDDATEEPVEIRPSEAELLRAAGWTVTGSERWEHTGKIVNIYRCYETESVSTQNRNGGTDTQFGSLMFRDGRLIEWGRTKKGIPLRPIERTRGVKGGGSTGRTEAAIWAYLKLPAAATSPLAATSYHRPFSGQRTSSSYEPLRRERPSAKDRYGRFGVEEARGLLRAHGVDGSVPFEQLPSAATRCPDGLLAGPQWVGGIKKPKPFGEISAAAGREPEIVRLVEVESHLANLRHLLGDHARVLDLAITDATAKEIGIAMGKAPAYAEKIGPWLIDAALDALIAADETARGAYEKADGRMAA